MDGLYEYLYEQKTDRQHVSEFITHLKDEAYDTESLIEDIPELKVDIDADNSMAFNTKFNSDIYRYMQKYIYIQKCMVFSVLGINLAPILNISSTYAI